MNWLDALVLHTRENRACVVVMISEVRGSAPRPVGTRLVVTADDFSDTLGGGALELEAISHARALLSAGVHAPAVSCRTILLGPALSQCCGGQITLQFDYHPATDFIVHVFGAGHVAQEVARVVQRLPCIATFHDSRKDWLDRLSSCVRAGDPGGLPGSAIHTRRLPENMHAVVENCEPGAYYLVMTHSHELDLELVEAVLSRGDSRYCGLIASRSKAAKFRNRLTRKGFSDTEIAKLTAPIGRDRKTGKTPMEVAVAAVSDILYERQLSASTVESNTEDAGLH